MHIVTVCRSINAYEISDTAELHNFYFKSENHGVPLSEVDPVVWLEGMDMADYVYLGFTIEGEDRS